MNFRIFLFSLIVLTSTLAWSKSEECESKNIKKISRPMVSNTKSKTDFFSYSFFHISADEGQPTVVFIPGGPGQTSIDNKGVEIPLNFGIIYTDPSGVGCNEVEGAKLSDEFFTTENVAADVVALISELKLNNYIIYGQSWGTTVAQIATNQIEKLALVPPKALVLEGVVGRAISNKTEAFEGFVKSWKSIKNQLEPDLVKSLTQQSGFMGLTSEEWGSSIRSRIIVGEEITVDFLTQVSRMPDYTVQTAVRANNDSAASVDLSRKKFYDLIACRQMYNGNSELNRNIVLKAGELDFGTTSFCRGINSLKPFNSKQWQVKTKTYYFSGSSDPLTPLWQRDYHMLNQRASAKITVTIRGAGHLPLRNNLLRVSNKIWNSINEGAENLQAIVEDF